jgi:hypothetical protein
VTRAEVRSEIGDLLAARNPEPNGPDQWLAIAGLSTPLGFIASPLHRVVRNQPFAGYWIP